MTNRDIGIASGPTSGGTRCEAAKTEAQPTPSFDETAFRHQFAEFVTEHLLDLSRVFAGDLELVLILAVLARTYLRSRIKAGSEGPCPCPSMTASDLAEITAIPRQTVRRKLLAMKTRGWVEQDSQQAWRLTTRDGTLAGWIDLREIDARGMQRAIGLAQAFSLDHAICK